jgi:hypothetical protein
MFQAMRPFDILGAVRRRAMAVCRKGNSGMCQVPRILLVRVQSKLATCELVYLLDE